MRNITLYDRLTGALIGLARAVIENDLPDDDAYRALADGLCVKPGNLAEIGEMIDRLHAEKRRIAPNCSQCASPCGRTADCDMEQFYGADDAVVKLRSAIMEQLRRAAGNAANDPVSREYHEFICETLFRLGYEDDAEMLARSAERAAEFVR